MSRILGVLLVASGMTYLYATYFSICTVPLSYEIVVLDERFNLSPEAAQAAVSEAEAVWETAASRDLFYLAKSGETPDVNISFIFDDRQERLLAEESLRETLDTKEVTTESLNIQYNKLTAEFQTKQARQAEATEAYEEDLASYNATVARYNEAGGAPVAVFAELTATEAKLAARLARLSKDSATLKVEAEKINKLGEEGNRLISQYNATVESYNEDFGEPDEFTQGDYQGGDIHVYTFQHKNELISVLAHEFGHALSLGHVEGSSSIMYYLLKDQPAPAALSPADQSALIVACGETDSLLTKIRFFINSFI